MSQGQVASIHLSRLPTSPELSPGEVHDPSQAKGEAHGQLLDSVRQVHAVPDRGLEGDRYFVESWSQRGRPDKEVTLIEAETVEAVNRKLHVQVPAGAFRRQIVTHGVSLNALVGREFTVGHVLLRGLRLCEPCTHVEQLAGVPGLMHAFAQKGGLRAQILTEGIIHVGDPVIPRVTAAPPG